ncbi:ABC transporter substrate-binding protein [Rhizobium tubonense]|uniref:ABC transporter substrate-binding protein n=1 Tax=Rhizobium tubonense TaxID=484088 RepID=A0A2W4EQV8_9HYPH|nr:ABC transporter substrate-binding protein [Rhizobium tubonense]PZM12960.1 ABC transporter substrate-binding protein [Rhizobium tubonense]
MLLTRRNAMYIASGTALAGFFREASFASAASDKTLSILFAFPESKSFQEPLAQRFMELHPDVKIDFRLSAPDYTEANLLIARGAINGDLPDIYFSGFAVLKPAVDTLSKRGIDISLENLLRSEGNSWIQGNFDESVLKLGQLDGVQFALPFNASTPIIYYNADLVKAAGHDPDNFPTDWDGLITLAKDIGGLGGGVGGLDFSVGSGSTDWLWQTTILSLGGEVTTADGARVGYENAIGLKAMRLIQRISKETNMTVATTVDPFRQQFFAGKLGFFATSPSSVANFTETVGNRFKLRTATFPVDADGGGLPTGGNAVTITAQDKSKRLLAWEYIKFITSPESQAFVAKATGYMPTNRNSEQTLSDFYKQNPNYQTAFKQASRSRPWYNYAKGNTKEIWKVQQGILDRVQRGGTSPEDGLKEIVQATNSLVK